MRSLVEADRFGWHAWLCCTNPLRDSPRDASLIAEMHEQLVHYKIQDDKLVVVQ